MQMDELACFAPGMLALGSTGYGPDEAEKFLSLAEEVLWRKYLRSCFARVGSVYPLMYGSFEAPD